MWREWERKTPEPPFTYSPQWYDEVYHKGRVGTDVKPFAEIAARSENHIDSTSRLLLRLPDDLDGKRWLELGCHLGMTAYAIKWRYPHARLVGIDWSKESVRFCSEVNPVQAEFLVGDCTCIPFTETFDVVTCIDVTEHLPRDKVAQCLEETRRVLSESGIAIIRPGTYSGNPEHIGLMSQEEMTNLLRQVGFAIRDFDVTDYPTWICSKREGAGILRERVPISFYAIVRNEATSIKHALASVEGLADEYVILDTGSTDSTADVVREWSRETGLEVRYERMVFPDDLNSSDREEWENMVKRCEQAFPGDAEARSLLFHFAGARNRAMRLCHGEWIIHLDGDEVLATPHDVVRAVIDEMPPFVKIPMTTIVMCSDEGEAQNRFSGERLYRNEPLTYFIGAMHNCLVGSDACRLLTPQIEIRHNRRHRHDSARAARNRQRLVNAECYFGWRVETNPQDLRALFYLATEYMNNARWSRAAELYQQYVDNASAPTPELYQAKLYLGRCLLQQRELQRAHQVLTSAIHENPWRAETFVALGDIQGNIGDMQVAEQFYRQALMCKQRPDPMFVEDAAFTWQPHYGLAQVYRHTGQTQKFREAREHAISLGLPDEFRKELFVDELQPPIKVAVFVDRGDAKFIDPVITAWKNDARFSEIRVYSEKDVGDFDGDGRLRIDGSKMRDILTWCDLAWFEWAAHLLIGATMLPKMCRIIVRVHGYETHTNLPAEVNWANVDDVIFTARYLQHLAEQKWPRIQNCRRFWFPNGVDLQKFRPPSSGKAYAGKKIAMAGYINPKKNIPLALQILHAARKRLPDLELHICGEIQDERTVIYLDHMAREMDLHGSVRLEPWQSDMAAWFADKDWILSTSIEESFHYAVAEAMACGCMPVVHAWQSSRDLYPAERIFTTVAEAVEIIVYGGLMFPAREWVQSHLSLEQMVRRYNRVIFRPRVMLAGSAAALREGWRIENDVACALESLGCELSQDDADLAIFLGHKVDEEIANRAKCKKVWWYAEQDSGDSEHAAQRRAEVAASEHLVDAVVRSRCDVYLGGARELFHVGETSGKTVDVLFYGLMNDRRRKILDDLRKQGIHVETANRFGEELAQLLQRTRVALNIHVTDAPNVETRICEALGCGAAVVTEPMSETDVTDTLRRYVFECETDKLADTIKLALEVVSSRDMRNKAQELRVAAPLWRQVEKVLEAENV